MPVRSRSYRGGVPTTGRCPPSCPRVGRQFTASEPSLRRPAAGTGVPPIRERPVAPRWAFAWICFSRVRGLRNGVTAHSTDAASDMVAFCQGCQRGRVAIEWPPRWQLFRSELRTPGCSRTSSCTPGPIPGGGTPRPDVQSGGSIRSDCDHDRGIPWKMSHLRSAPG